MNTLRFRVFITVLLLGVASHAPAQTRRPAPVPTLEPNGSELFRGLFNFYGIESLTIEEFNQTDKKDVIVVILGLPGPDSDFENLEASTANVLKAGGAVLIAADQQASLSRYFPDQADIAVTGEWVSVPARASYFGGKPQCPFAVPLAASIVDIGKWEIKNRGAPTPEWMLFPSMNKLATNMPSTLRMNAARSKYVWSRLAGFPPQARLQGTRKPSNQRERLFAVGGAGMGDDTYRSLVLADPSVFTNQMLAPEPTQGTNQNFAFARRVVQWLREPNERSRCLFVEAGKLQTDFSAVNYAKLMTPPMPPLPPLPPLPSPLDPKLQRGVNDFLDRQLAELEDRDIPNHALGGSERRFQDTMRVLSVLAAMLALLYFLRRVWKARHEPDLPPMPSDTGRVTGSAPPGSLARRREELLQSGDYTEVVREYLRELFAERGLPPQPTPALRQHPPATVSGPDAGTLRHHLRILWKVAHGCDGRAINYTRWKELEPLIDALKRAADEDRWRFVEPGEMA